MAEVKPSDGTAGMAQVAKDDPEPEGSTEEISIAGPMGFWIAVLLIGLLVQFVLAPVATSAGLNAKYFTSIGHLILYQPGAIILPLIVAVWLGAKVGRIHKKSPSVGKIGMINAVYAAVVYSIAVFIIYLAIYYINASALPVMFTLGGFGLYLIVIPDVIILVITPLLAMLSSARHPKK